MKLERENKKYIFNHEYKTYDIGKHTSEPLCYIYKAVFITLKRSLSERKRERMFDLKLKL